MLSFKRITKTTSVSPLFTYKNIDENKARIALSASPAAATVFKYCAGNVEMKTFGIVEVKERHDGSHMIVYRTEPSSRVCIL